MQRIGNGLHAIFWFDWWTDLGPLLSAIGPIGSRLRSPSLGNFASVSAAVVMGTGLYLRLDQMRLRPFRLFYL